MAGQENRALDPLRSIYWVGGYTEGWAEYAVSLAAEQGLFDEPHERLWRTHTDLASLEVDTQIQRSAAIPGQLLAYRLGYEKLRELRGTAERELGKAFDLREFHEVMVADGALPLGVLESKTRRYIDGKRD